MSYILDWKISRLVVGLIDTPIVQWLASRSIAASNITRDKPVGEVDSIDRTS